MKTMLMYASVLGFLVACGGRGSNGGPDGNVDTSDTDDPADFCRSAAQTYCDTLYDCLTEDELDDAGLPATVGECEREMNASCRNGVDNCEFNEEYAYSPTMAAQCLDQMSDATCVDAAQEYLGASACEDICQLQRGMLSVTWAFSPSSESCSTTGVERVRVYLDGPTRLSQDFDCYNGVAYFTEAFPTGTYSVRIGMFGSAGTELWQSQPKSAVLDQESVTVNITVPVSSN